MKYRNFSSRNSNKLSQLVVALSVVSACAVSVSACASGGDDDNDADSDSDSTDKGNGGAGTGGGNSTGGTTGNSVCDQPDATIPPAIDDTNHLSALGTSVGGAGGAGNTPEDAIRGWDAFQATRDADVATGAKLTVPSDYDPVDARAPGLIETGGPDEANDRYIQYAGTGWVTYGAGMNFGLNGANQCTDLNDYKGIKFFARGYAKAPSGQTKPPEASTLTNKVYFRINTPGANATADGGDCVLDDANTHKCFNPPQVAIELPGSAPGTPGTWTEYTVLFSDLKTTVPAASMATNQNRAQSIGWFSSPGDFDMQVTNVRLCADDCGSSTLAP